MTTMKQILYIICCAVLMAACKKDDNKDTPPTPSLSERTVMVYMAGDNNLSSVVMEDIQEMQKGASGIPQNCN